MVLLRTMNARQAARRRQHPPRTIPARLHRASVLYPHSALTALLHSRVNAASANSAAARYPACAAPASAAPHPKRQFLLRSFNTVSFAFNTNIDPSGYGNGCGLMLWSSNPLLAADGSTVPITIVNCAQRPHVQQLHPALFLPTLLSPSSSGKLW